MSFDDEGSREPGPGRGWDGDGASGGAFRGEESRYLVTFDERESTGVSGSLRGLAVVLAVAGAAYVLFGSIELRDWAVDLGFGRVIATPVGSDSSAAPVRPPYREPGPPPTFARDVDSLDEALARYHERRRLYDEGRLGCESLGRAHEWVDRRFLRVALTFRDLRATLDSSAHARFNDVAGRADQVDRHFDGLDCPSPG